MPKNDTNLIDRGQVSHHAAEVYEAFFVPALFAEWATRVVEAAELEAGAHVLDVACGTGILARTVAQQVGAHGSVVGIDVNEGMLAVAKRCAPQIEWRKGQAEALPFLDNSFDAVVSQFGLMFFEDRVKAILEMARVLRPGGRLVIAVWDALEKTPGYQAMDGMLRQLFGDEVAGRLAAPFVLGNQAILRDLCIRAGIPQAEITAVMGSARFPSIEQWVYTEIKGWTLADAIDDAGYERLLQEAEVRLRPYAQSDGTVLFAAPALLISTNV